jgi:hemoglobin/transferrin/lactoferrin receptor protein
MRLRVLSTSLDDQDTSGANLRAEMKFSSNSRTLAGLELEDDALEADKTTDTTRTPPGMTITQLRYDDAETRTLSVFGQHEMSFNDRFTATAGARWYRVRSDHDASTTNGGANPTSDSADNLLLGSASLVWTPHDHLALRANVSQGYIYPNLGQLYLTTSGGGVTLVGNPDLDPETSTTYELGARYAVLDTMLDVTLFYADSEDYIATVPAEGTYQNVDAARSWGVEVYAEHALGVWGLTPYTSFAAMRRQLRFANGYDTYDGGSPAFSGKVGLRKDWSWGRTAGSVDLFARGESKVRQRGDDGALDGSASGYATLHLRIHADLGAGLDLVAELNNLTNRSYSPYDQMPGAERSSNLFLTKKF